MKVRSEHRAFGGVQGFYEHASALTGTTMRFGVYRPPQSEQGPVPVLLTLAGLTCTEETFFIKAGAQRLAAEHGLMLVSPDTSPRDTGLPGATGDWEFGEGAGFYLNATQAPWSSCFQMHDYLLQELIPTVALQFGARGRVGVMGHSMGGHGALVAALRHPDVFASVSAIAPISHPSACPWGRKAFGRYLGDHSDAWAEWDATELVRRGARVGDILVDQGEADRFLHEGQLLPEDLEAACAEAGQPLTLRRHPGYDHGYYFIATVIADHLAHHAARLQGSDPNS